MKYCKHTDPALGFERWVTFGDGMRVPLLLARGKTWISPADR
jgi:hypothetical protein